VFLCTKLFKPVLPSNSQKKTCLNDDLAVSDNDK
jgi:hypothetical protein